MHILIAPNAFKHSLTATEAAAAIRQGLEASRYPGTLECFPIADGGDGTGELIVGHNNGRVVHVTVRDPLGRPVRARFGLIEEGNTAVIEMADASGLRLLDKNELNPLRASSFGTGELIRQALDTGARRIILGVGGSATVDGGCGILQALGARFLDEAGRELEGLPENLVSLESVDLKGLDSRLLDCDLCVLCDVDNPLTGEQGAAAVFGPQKGASPEMVIRLEAGLKRLAGITRIQRNLDIVRLPGGGAAGGVTAGLYGFVNARLVNGIDEFLAITGFDKRLEGADLLITGEGSLDEQTLHGKGPFGVARKARSLRLPVIGLAGRVPLQPLPEMYEYFDVLLAIGNEPAELATAMQTSAANLVRTGRAIGNLLIQPLRRRSL